MPKYFCTLSHSSFVGVENYRPIYLWADNEEQAIEFAKGIWLLQDVVIERPNAITSCYQYAHYGIFEHDCRADQSQPLPLPKEVIEDV